MRWRVVLLLWTAVTLLLIAVVVITYEVAHGALDGRSALMVVLFGLIIAICVVGVISEVRGG